MTTRSDSKRALKDEWGTAKRKKIEKIQEEEALAKAAELDRLAEEQEEKTRDVEFMSGKQAEARQAAVADLARAPTAAGQEAVALAALGSGDARRVAEASRQSVRGAQEGIAQAAAEKGFQAGQEALAAEQAMVNQLRERQNALLVTAGEPPVPFAEKALQTVAEDTLRRAPAFAAELAVPGTESDQYKNFGGALTNAYGTPTVSEDA